MSRAWHADVKCTAGRRDGGTASKPCTTHIRVKAQARALALVLAQAQALVKALALVLAQTVALTQAQAHALGGHVRRGAPVAHLPRC